MNIHEGKDYISGGKRHCLEFQDCHCGSHLRYLIVMILVNQISMLP